MYLWWYGLSYALGFLQIHLFLRRERLGLGLTRWQVHALSLLFLSGVLIGGRAIEVAFDEWPFYRAHPWLIPAYWLGGMATHGLLIGAAAATWVFAAWQKVPFLRLADAIVIPGAFLMGMGRLGNFIDGQIVGSVTDVWWAVKFPDAEGFRHPVVLYDGLKNLALIPYLLHARRRPHPPGAIAARFVFWYASLRIVVDLFRDYPTHRLALGTGQTLNIAMTLLGLGLLARVRLRRIGWLAPRHEAPVPAPGTRPDRAPSIVQRTLLATALLFSLTLPSNWTQDIPRRYAKRHPGLEYSWLYPRVPDH